VVEEGKFSGAVCSGGAASYVIAQTSLAAQLVAAAGISAVECVRPAGRCVRYEAAPQVHEFSAAVILVSAQHHAFNMALTPLKLTQDKMPNLHLHLPQRFPPLCPFPPPCPPAVQEGSGEAEVKDPPSNPEKKQATTNRRANPVSLSELERGGGVENFKCIRFFSTITTLKTSKKNLCLQNSLPPAYFNSDTGGEKVTWGAGLFLFRA
jgi:hypothetical protein